MDIWELKKKSNLYYIRVNNFFFQCEVGLSGIISENKKIEGDKHTPSGEWILKKVYYRDDRVHLKKIIENSFLPLVKITKNCGWCDDSKCKEYNRYITIQSKGITFKHSYEKLWRSDRAYDIIIEINYNVNPIIKNKGSAIFIHCSFENNRSTSGCIALDKNILIDLIKKIKKETKIVIN